MSHRPSARLGRPLALAALIVVATLAGCFGDARVDQHVLVASLVDLKARGAGTVVNFDSLVPTPWIRMWAFGPYTDLKRLSNCTRAPKAERLLNGIDGDDRVNLLVFQFPDSEYVAMRLSRSVFEFGAGVGRRTIARRDARFVLRTDSTGVLSAVLTDSTVAAEDCGVINIP